MKYLYRNIYKNKGFSLIEIIISIALLSIIFSFMFYFLSTLNINIDKDHNSIFTLDNYNYSDQYCDLNDNIIKNISIVFDFDMSSYISTSTIVTDINIINNNRLIISTNSSSTTENDLYLFAIDFMDNSFDLNLMSATNTGPGVNGMIVHNEYVYLLNTSVNSHLQTYKIENNDLININNFKIQELTTAYSMPKNIYLLKDKILIGSEKNNYGGELFSIKLEDNMPISIDKSIEIGGQVNDIYEFNNILYIANASDIELLIFDKTLELINQYDAPLSLGNGKSVYLLYPYIYLGRTISSFELFNLSYKEDNILTFIYKHKIGSSIDFIQDINNKVLLFTNNSNRELQFFDLHNNGFLNIKNLDLPSRAESYTCFEGSI